MRKNKELLENIMREEQKIEDKNLMMKKKGIEMICEKFMEG